MMCGVAAHHHVLLATFTPSLLVVRCWHWLPGHATAVIDQTPPAIPRRGCGMHCPCVRRRPASVIGPVVRGQGQALPCVAGSHRQHDGNDVEVQMRDRLAGQTVVLNDGCAAHAEGALIGNGCTLDHLQHWPALVLRQRMQVLNVSVRNHECVTRPGWLILAHGDGEPLIVQRQSRIADPSSECIAEPTSQHVGIRHDSFIHEDRPPGCNRAED